MTHLNPQINHLVSSRPMAVTMGNAIRQLKLEISNISIDMPEQDVSHTPIVVRVPILNNFHDTSLKTSCVGELIITSVTE